MSASTLYHASTRSLGALAVAAVLGFVVLLAPSTSAGQTNASVGVKAGMNWSKLIQPVDPKNSVTLMHGTAFDGFGFALGGSAKATFGGTSGARFGLEIDALYSRHRATGFEENPETGARRTAVLTTDVLRIPALFVVEFSGLAQRTGLYAGLGPELWAGLRSSSTVTLQNTSADAQALTTTPVTHAVLNATVGFDVDAGPRLAIPFELRGTWDPFVGTSTYDRFEGYRSRSVPGAYEVAFNWQLMLMTGFSFDVL